MDALLFYEETPNIEAGQTRGGPDRPGLASPSIRTAIKVTDRLRRTLRPRLSARPRPPAASVRVSVSISADRQAGPSRACARSAGQRSGRLGPDDRGVHARRGRVNRSAVDTTRACAQERVVERAAGATSRPYSRARPAAARRRHRRRLAIGRFAITPISRFTARGSVSTSASWSACSPRSAACRSGRTRWRRRAASPVAAVADVARVAALSARARERRVMACLSRGREMPSGYGAGSGPRDSRAMRLRLRSMLERRDAARQSPEAVAHADDHTCQE